MKLCHRYVCIGRVEYGWVPYRLWVWASPGVLERTSCRQGAATTFPGHDEGQPGERPSLQGSRLSQGGRPTSRCSRGRRWAGGRMGGAQGGQPAVVCVSRAPCAPGHQQVSHDKGVLPRPEQVTKAQGWNVQGLKGEARRKLAFIGTLAGACFPFIEMGE